MYNRADEGVQFKATEVFSLLRRHCSVSNGTGVQRERYIQANSVEPYSYLALVLTDMQYMGKPFSNEELESLMPWSEEMKQSIVRRTKPTSSSDE